jgi:hypothetical protein
VQSSAISRKRILKLIVMIGLRMKMTLSRESPKPIPKNLGKRSRQKLIISTGFKNQPKKFVSDGRTT